MEQMDSFGSHHSEHYPRIAWHLDFIYTFYTNLKNYLNIFICVQMNGHTKDKINVHEQFIS